MGDNIEKVIVECTVPENFEVPGRGCNYSIPLKSVNVSIQSFLSGGQLKAEVLCPYIGRDQDTGKCSVSHQPCGYIKK
jgi:hypothetical protein